MAFSIRRAFKRRGTEDDKQQISTIDVTNQQIEGVMSEICILELAFWSCVEKYVNVLSMCEFRTFANGKEVFGDEYYAWNYSPNKNQNKAQFLGKALNMLFRNNELLIIESMDGQLLVADSYSKVYSALYGNRFQHVTVDDYEFSRTFYSEDVLFWELNNQNIHQVLVRIFQAYQKLISYTSDAYMKSHGNRGILDISAMARAADKNDEVLKRLLNDYFKSFFSANNAVLPLFEGYHYTDLGSKTYADSNTRDLKNQYDDIFDFTARAFSIPPILVKGDVQNTSDSMTAFLTLGLDPLCERLTEEINRKRYGPEAIRSKTYMRIDSKHVRHVDLLTIGANVDKLISSGLYSVNMLLRAIGEPQIEEEWANQHIMTKNYMSITDFLQQSMKQTSAEGDE